MLDRVGFAHYQSAVMCGNENGNEMRHYQKHYQSLPVSGNEESITSQRFKGILTALTAFLYIPLYPTFF